MINAKKKEKRNIGNVLLTGATGFLGAHILDYLLNHTKSNVYCIIRKDSNNATSTTDKLLNKLHYYFEDKYDYLLNKRLFVVTSDISIDNLGLTDAQMQDLSNNVSCVINSAAIVKHFGDYIKRYFLRQGIPRSARNMTSVPGSGTYGPMETVRSLMST